jgi:hypothetical protein
MAERMIEANGVELCAESFGDLADSPLLLVMGLGASPHPRQAVARTTSTSGRFQECGGTGRSASAEASGDVRCGDMGKSSGRLWMLMGNVWGTSSWKALVCREKW